MPASFIQSKNGLSSAVATVSLTDNGGSTIATTAGDWLLVDIVYINSGASRTISAAPTAAGTFVQVGTPYYVSDVGRIWGYIPNCLAVTNALQFTLSASCSNIGLYVGQVRGLSAFAGDNGNVKQTNPGTGAGAITASLTVPSMSCYVWGNAWARNIASWLSTQSDTAESPVWNASGNPQHGRSTAPGTRSLTWTATNGTDDFYKLAMAFTESAQILPAVSTFHPGRSPGYPPQSGRFFQVPSSYALAAPSGAIAGTGGITFGQSGTLTGSGALAGTAALTFGQSGNLTAAGALAGTASIAFGQTGTLTGAGALAGISALTFGQSGALTGAGSLSATTALTFGQSGALTGAGALAGTAPLTFAASATADLPLGALAGAIAITFAASGTLAASGALSGTTPIVFGASATADQAASQSGQTPAGGFAGRRRRRMFIEIDGQTFEVESAEHAQALLDQAKALARQTAPQKAEANLIVHLGTRPRERPKIERPHIVTFSPELHEIVRKARTVITDTYKAAYRDTEIRLRMGEKVSEDDADDDDFLMML